MIALVIGGSGSGKSAFAERLCLAAARRGADATVARDLSVRRPAPPLYIATMPRGGAEAERRIERHRALRAGKGFELLERPSDLASARVPPCSVALLECLGTLVANELFSGWEGAGPLDPARARAASVEGIERLTARVPHVVIVTNDVFADGLPYDGGTMAYIDLLADLNRSLAARADAVVEVVCGIPLWHQGRGVDWGLDEGKRGIDG